MIRYRPSNYFCSVNEMSNAIQQKALSEFDIPSDFKNQMMSNGWNSLFPIQFETYDLIRDHKDVLGRDRTGTGKTLAFTLPTIINLLEKKQSGFSNPNNAPAIGKSYYDYSV